MRVKISDLKVDKNLFIRSGLSEDAVQRYMELYQSGREKALKIQKGTNIVVDGWHRLEAARRLDLKDVLVEVVDVEDRELRALAYKCNRAHGVPLSREERNKLIVDLYYKDNKTPVQIEKLVGLSERWIREIIRAGSTSETNKTVDKLAVARLILGGEKQEDVAEKFGVSQGRISQIWAVMRDSVYKLYTEERLLKREVAERVGLTLDEVDKILQEYGDPLNFELMTSTWWPSFGLDKRFGADNPSQLPADLVRNILALYTKPGDVILDPAAGGGVVLDVANDMVNRKCYAYDLVPQRDDIKTHNILVEPPAEPKKPNLIFLDLPYGPAKSGEYSPAHSSDLANKPPSEFLEDLRKIFGYWDSGTLVVLMSSYRSEGELVDLPFEAEKRMVGAGWKIAEHIVNEHGRVSSETGYWVEKAKEERWLLRKHIHILVGKK
jgi:hypothetical protein